MNEKPCYSQKDYLRVVLWTAQGEMQYNILLNLLLAIVPCIALSCFLVLALVLMWHSGEPVHPVNWKEKTQWLFLWHSKSKASAGGEGGRKERDSEGRMPQIGLGCLQLSALVTTGPKSYLGVRYK